MSISMYNGRHNNNTTTKGKNMYQIFFMPENSFDIHVADVSREYFAEFCKDKLIIKILPY